MAHPLTHLTHGIPTRRPFHPAKTASAASISPGASCPSDCANGRTSSDQWDSVIIPKLANFHVFGAFEQEKDPDLGGVMPRLVGFSRFAALPESKLTRRYTSTFSPMTK
jgi:hypothetical protein